MDNSKNTNEGEMTIFCKQCKSLFPDEKSHPGHSLGKQKIPEDLLKSYQFISCLGVGAYGAVFKVLERDDESFYALKLLQYQEEDEIEFKILKEMDHPNIIRYFRTIKRPKEGYLGIVTEIADYDLMYLIKEKKLTNEEIYNYAIQISEAVNYLHNVHNPKIIHRDLKPANILLKNGKIKIADFGIAKTKKNDASVYSDATQVAGTCLFLPPEYLSNIDSENIKFNDKVDIWALGIIFYQMITNGSHPFNSGTGFMTEMANIIKNKRNFDENLNKDSVIYKAIMGCLEYEPEKRLSIKEILEILKKNDNEPISILEKAKAKEAVKEKIPGFNFPILTDAENQILDLSNGSYFGQVANEKPHGYGIKTYNDGDKYEGFWKNGVFHGKGIYTWKNGERYEGDEFEGDATGYGKYYYSNGSRYEGEFKQMNKHGKGKYFYANGATYEGDYINDKIDGNGIYCYANGDKYEGIFKAGCKHIKGIYYYKNGEKYDGAYNMDEMEGFAVYNYLNGDKYEGEFKKGLKHGNGKYTYKNGDRHQGEYKDGLKDGPGIYYYNDGNKEECIYKAGKITGKSKYYKGGQIFERTYDDNWKIIKERQIST